MDSRNEIKLSILIATIGRRKPKFLLLLEELFAQIVEGVEVVAYWNNGELSIGELRQKLVEDSKGEYVCFIDDDDMVPPYYVKEILKNLGQDYVGFIVRLFNNRVEQKNAIHSLKYKTWHEDRHAYYRDVTHLNPIMRSLAIQATYKKLDAGGEDADWASQVRPYVHSENFINRRMYFYYHDRDDSNFGGQTFVQETYDRPSIKNPCFRWHPDSKLTNRRL